MGLHCDTPGAGLLWGNLLADSGPGRSFQGIPCPRRNSYQRHRHKKGDRCKWMGPPLAEPREEFLFFHDPERNPLEVSMWITDTFFIHIFINWIIFIHYLKLLLSKKKILCATSESAISIRFKNLCMTIIKWFSLWLDSEMEKQLTSVCNTVCMSICCWAAYKHNLQESTELGQQHFRIGEAPLGGLVCTDLLMLRTLGGPLLPHSPQQKNWPKNWS